MVKVRSRDISYRVREREREISFHQDGFFLLPFNFVDYIFVL